jgi:hypothetical protein
LRLGCLEQGDIYELVGIRRRDRGSKRRLGGHPVYGCEWGLLRDTADLRRFAPWLTPHQQGGAHSRKDQKWHDKSQSTRRGAASILRSVRGKGLVAATWHGDEFRFRLF